MKRCLIPGAALTLLLASCGDPGSPFSVDRTLPPTTANDTTRPGGAVSTTAETTGTITVAPPTTAAATAATAATTVAPATATTEPPTSIGVGGGEVAWIGGFGVGLTAFAPDGTVHPFREELGNLDNDQIHDIAITPDGTAWIAHSTGISRVDAARWVDLGTRGFEAVAVDSTTGDLWAVRYQTAARYDGTTWTEHPSTEFGQGEYVDLVKDVAVDPEGRAWVVTASTVAMFDGSDWTWWGEGNGIPEFPYGTSLTALDAAPDGRIWVSHSNGVLVYDGTDWVNTDPGVSQPGNVTATDDGRILVASHSDGLAVNEGGQWRVVTAAQSGLVTDRVREAAVDGLGRLWIGTTWGLSVYDGTAWTTFDMATARMSGNLVEAIAIAGDGPELPAPTAPRTGNLEGTILTSGEPLTGTGVLLCSDSPGFVFSGEHPCTRFPFWQMATTDADGVYRFEGVPVGDYELVWEDSTGEWRAFMMGGVEPAVRAGVTTTVPPVDEAD